MTTVDGCPGPVPQRGVTSAFVRRLQQYIVLPNRVYSVEEDHRFSLLGPEMVALGVAYGALCVCGFVDVWLVDGQCRVQQYPTGSRL